MNPSPSPTQKISEVIEQYQAGIILLQANPTVDAIAAATALYLALSKQGKNISLACSNPPQSNLVAADKINTSLIAGGDNLVISFPYTEGSIDKVDYNIQGNFFNLIIVPRSGYPKLQPDKVNYTYTGAKIDYIITIDAPNLNSLGQIYTENQQEFQGKNIINIDRHLINNSYGTVNFINKTSSSTSELVFQLIRDMRIEIDKDMATNLYTGLLAATNNFTSYSVNPSTFEIASELMRLGAQKKQTGMPDRQNGNPGFPPMQPPPNGNYQQPQPAIQGGYPPYNNAPIQQQAPIGKNNGIGAPQGNVPFFPQQHLYQNNQQNAPFNNFPQNNPGTQYQSQNEQQNKPIDQVEKEEGNKKEAANPQNWLKPKIFGGKNKKG